MLEIPFVSVRLLNFPQRETFPINPETNTQKNPEGLSGLEPGGETLFLSDKEGRPLGCREHGGMRGLTPAQLLWRRDVPLRFRPGAEPKCHLPHS